MLHKPDRKIITEDGAEYLGYGFGAKKDAVLEIVFNTSMAGYQEILSDPSYTDQAVVMTYPLIGNYGMAADDYETETPTIGGLIVREYNDEPSNFRSEETLGSVMERYGIPGVSSVDTRKIGRSIRDLGSRKILITSPETTLSEGLSILKDAVLPHDAVKRVSCRQIETFVPDFPDGSKPDHALLREASFSTRNAAHTARGLHVVLVDCGMKRNILRSLLAHGCRVTVVPYDTGADAIRALKPDGIMLSNGPGDPTDVPETIAAVRSLIGSLPVFGICLGHQILSLAYGASTYKLLFGHRGGNHPVKNLMTGRIEITSQNHSYAVDEDSLCGTPLTVTHRNLLDNTIEGVACEKDRAFSVQYHPESAPGPQDSMYLFDRFIRLMEEYHAEKN